MDDNQTPARIAGSVPQISGEAMQHVGRYANAIVLSCFEQIGGMERMVTWAETNPTDFYTKLFPKIMQRTATVDISANLTLDDAISRLENQPLIGEYTDVYDL